MEGSGSNPDVATKPNNGGAQNFWAPLLLACFWCGAGGAVGRTTPETKKRGVGSEHLCCSLPKPHASQRLRLHRLGLWSRVLPTGKRDLQHFVHRRDRDQLQVVAHLLRQLDDVLGVILR